MASTTSPLLNLPPELRLRIYHYLFDPEANACTINTIEKTYDFSAASALLRTNKQIYDEAHNEFRQRNKFIRVKTPFPQTLENIIQRQQVPIAMKNGPARRFSGCHLLVIVMAPGIATDYDDDSCQFIIHLRDLDAFCEQWQWAQLSYSINEHLVLELELRAPFTPDYDTPQLPKALQKALIMPFGVVKDLQRTDIRGQVRLFSTIETDMRTMQAQPYKSVETSLKECVSLQEQGMQEVRNRQYETALQTFFKAMRAIHILVVHDDDRQLLADAYYQHVTLREEPYADKDGQEERMKLRVKLVACVCEALGGMEDWTRCSFWATRSIKLLRSSYGLDVAQLRRPEDEAIQHVFERQSWATIYRFGAKSEARLGNRANAIRWYAVARAYAPAMAKEITEEMTSETSA